LRPAQREHFAMARLLLVAVAGWPVQAIDNGLGLTPPLGWRSWNVYGHTNNQTVMELVLAGMVIQKRTVDGVPTSLCELGYCNVGVDDNWQDCNAGDKYSYHDNSGRPLVNLERFPNLTALTEHAHLLGLTAGWYANNCACREVTVIEEMYEEDVKALLAYGFDATKLDGCGQEMDLDKWASLLNQTGRPIMIENCHWGKTVPTETWCPWNFFRTSGDIHATYGSVIGNLQTTIHWAQTGLSKPGCWGYPDMLEVGVKNGVHGPVDVGLSYHEARSHFSSWAIVSSPLTLSMDVMNDTIMDEVWDIISNKEILAVNQAWAGHSGSPFKSSSATVDLHDYHDIVKGIPQWQFFYKPVGGGRIAVLLMNHGTTALDLVLNFKDVPGLVSQKCSVRCLYMHTDLGEHEGNFTARAVPSHDSRMFMLTPLQEAVYV